MLKKKKGQALPEWSVAVLLVTVICMVATLSLAPHMKGILNNITNALNGATSQQQTNSQQ